MVVEVEDYFVDYVIFEGEIFKGQYGGGYVVQFDYGVWVMQGDLEVQFVKGYLCFELFGVKLKGGWYLVCFGKLVCQLQWLLFKDDDEFVGDIEVDDLLVDVVEFFLEDLKWLGVGKIVKKRFVIVFVRCIWLKNWVKKVLVFSRVRKGVVLFGLFELQLVKLGDVLFQGEQWVYEIKWDGYCIFVMVVEGNVQFWFRNVLEWIGKIFEICDVVVVLGFILVVLDGEFIVGVGIKEDFNLLQVMFFGEC